MPVRVKSWGLIGDALLVGLIGGTLLALLDGLLVLLEGPVSPYLPQRLWVLSYLALFYAVLGALTLGFVGVLAAAVLSLRRRQPDRLWLLAGYTGLAAGTIALLHGFQHLRTFNSPPKLPGFVGPSTGWQVDLLRLPQTAPAGERLAALLLLIPLSLAVGLAAAWACRANAPRLLARLSRPARRRLLLVVLLLLVLPPAGRALYQGVLRDLLPRPPAGPAASPEQPNIVLISIDALRADALGAYGYDPQVSPRIDALADHGIVFEQAISQAPWTYPSLLSLHTSLYPSALGFIQGNPDAYTLDSARNTLAEGLQQAGYRTQAYLTNAWTRPDTGLDQGFDGYETPRAPYSFDPEYLQEYAAGLSLLYQHAPALYQAFEQGYNLLFDPRLHFWSDSGEQMNADVRRFLGLYHGERFFLWLHYIEPHDPYNPSQSFRPFPAAIGAIRSRWLWEITGMNAIEWASQLLRPVDMGALQSLYAGEVVDVDAQVGEVLDELARWGLSDRTVVVITADHGEEFADHGNLGHARTLYQELVHIPLIIAGSPVAVPGRRVVTPVQNLDLMPTLLEIARAPIPPEIQGRSLLPFLRGEELPNRPVFSEANSNSVWNLRAVQSGDVKLIYKEGQDQVELYDLRQDPHEQRDLSQADAAVADGMQKLVRTWAAHMSEVAALLKRSDAAGGLDETTLRALHNGGY